MSVTAEELRKLTLFQRCTPEDLRPVVVSRAAAP
jgi:hypothetical protein